jgi:hypothetical protein
MFLASPTAIREINLGFRPHAPHKGGFIFEGKSAIALYSQR